MTLGEKLRYLREVEGTLRGLDREMTQQEMARLIQKELGKSISQSYLSQIESGARPHLTNSTRMLLARFFKVHPGYLVDDPEGFSDRTDFRCGRARRQAGSVADQRRGALPPRRGSAPGAADRRAACGFAHVPGAVGHHSGKSGAGRALMEVLEGAARHRRAKRGGVHDLVGLSISSAFWSASA